VSANELSPIGGGSGVAENHTQEIDGTSFLLQLRSRDAEAPPDTVRLGESITATRRRCCRRYWRGCIG